MPVRQQLSFDQESGFLVRIVGLSSENMPLSTMSYSDIKVNPPIPPERFSFTVPEGVEVEEETGPQPPTVDTAPASGPTHTQP
jgi:outer membrane lipoprotein-sorting protein